MRRFLFLTVFLAGCGTESAYGQPAWTMAGDAAAEAEASADSAADAGHDAADARADVGKDSREDTATDAAVDSRPRVCEPGKQEACACVGGALGAQRCAGDGMSWEACACPDSASDSAIDAAADTSADSGTDSAADAPVDTGTDSGSAVDSGADVGPAVLAECGANLIYEFGTPCEGEFGADGTGLFYDKGHGLLWTTKTKLIPGGKWEDYDAYCKSKGMSLPTVPQAKTILNSCAVICHWVTWTTTLAPSGKPYFMTYYAGTTGTASPDTDFVRALCVKP